ncbi:MAG: glycosyltransferase family 2 protein [Actinobacteria bacterium]|nr:MAG: glycosyltransferase family 2 protein [Actinomycetota bacterium]
MARALAYGSVAFFDLIVATVDRVDELDGLLASLERQTFRDFRVIVVDQNEDDRLADVLRKRDVTHLRSTRGLSRARNVALGQVDAQVVAFPDDDCRYPDDLLERVAERLADDTLEGLTGREVDVDGNSSASWRRDVATLTRDNLWNRAISFTIFLRASLVGRVGEFDEELGLGSGTRWSSGEETDYLIRAVDAGARIEYDPDVVVVHAGTARPAPEVGARDGASLGYILRKHRYPLRTVGGMLGRPVGGAMLALARRDTARAAFHVSTLRGRLRGYRAA